MVPKMVWDLKLKGSIGVKGKKRGIGLSRDRLQKAQWNDLLVHDPLESE